MLRHPRPFRFLLSRLSLRGGWSLPGSAVVSLSHQVRVRLRPTPIAHQFWLRRTPDDTLVTIFTDLINEGDTVLDIGANIGTHTLLASKIAAHGRVLACEPGFPPYQYLLENISDNQCTNVVPLCVAVSEVNGSAAFAQEHRSHEQSHLVPTNTTESTNGYDAVPVATMRLDTLLTWQGVSEVHFLKLDVEGAELSVLRSLGDRLRDVQTIYFEHAEHNYQRYGYKKEAVCDFLTSAGYTLYVPSVTAGRLELQPYSASFPGKNVVAKRVV